MDPPFQIHAHAAHARAFDLCSTPSKRGADAKASFLNELLGGTGRMLRVMIRHRASREARRMWSPRKSSD